jgi:hypothetical protein
MIIVRPLAGKRPNRASRLTRAGKTFAAIVRVIDGDGDMRPDDAVRILEQLAP